ncbi:hypothetical protein [Microbacterium sp. A93]|uniref:hypothetical protein n=1 Tax=Microbacterium sp. A93 TaxID=3450716 RepID=UPI003F424C5B
MKYPLKAVAAAVLVSSALFAAPAAAADASTGSVLPSTFQTQPVSKSSGGASTMGFGEGAKIIVCGWWGLC